MATSEKMIIEAIISLTIGLVFITSPIKSERFSMVVEVDSGIIFSPLYASLFPFYAKMLQAISICNWL